MTYMVKPQHKNPYQGGHKIFNFGRPFPDRHYYVLSLSESCTRLEKKIFQG